MNRSRKETAFMDLLHQYKDVVAKVCYLYSSPDAPFDDLYQEALANLWEGMESFRGEAKMSTWVYRTALNTCITWFRRNRRHTGTYSLDQIVEPAADDRDRMSDYRMLHALISRLEPMEKALIGLWLDEKPYDEIAAITGISKANVAVRIHRIKDKLSRLADDDA